MTGNKVKVNAGGKRKKVSGGPNNDNKRKRQKSSSSAGPSSGNGKERRKQERLEKRQREKAAKKARKEQRAGKKVDEEEFVEKQMRQRTLMKEKLQRESKGRKVQQMRKMQETQLEAAIEHENKRLRAWYPGKEEFLAKREMDKNRFDPNKLRGAARPAEEAYPWLYPEYHAEKERKEQEEDERELNRGDDILAMYDKHWGNHLQTRRLYKMHLNLALVHRNKNHGDKAIEHLQKIVEMDEDRYLGSIVPWLYAETLIDQEQLGEARVVIENELKRNENKGDPFRAMLLWDLVLIECIGHFLLKEETVKLEDAQNALEQAYEANPSISMAILCGDAFEQVVNPDVVQEATWNYLEPQIEAFVTHQARAEMPDWSFEHQAIMYFDRAISFWRDTEDSIMDFLRQFTETQDPPSSQSSQLQENTTPLDEMYAAANQLILNGGVPPDMSDEGDYEDDDGDDDDADDEEEEEEESK